MDNYLLIDDKDGKVLDHCDAAHGLAAEVIFEKRGWPMMTTTVMSQDSAMMENELRKLENQSTEQ